MDDPECRWCGRNEDLQPHGCDLELLCPYCRRLYDENERINARDEELEERRLTK